LIFNGFIFEEGKKEKITYSEPVFLSSKMGILFKLACALKISGNSLPF